MIREFRQTFKVELPFSHVEIVAFRIQTGSRPLYRRNEASLALQDRWLVQTVYRRLGLQQGLDIVERTVVFEAKCEWEKAFPQTIQIEYLNRPYCVGFQLEDLPGERTQMSFTLSVHVEIDLDLVAVLCNNPTPLRSQLHRGFNLPNIADFEKRLQVIEACLGMTSRDWVR